MPFLSTASRVLAVSAYSPRHLFPAREKLREVTWNTLLGTVPGQ